MKGKDKVLNVESLFIDWKLNVMHVCLLSVFFFVGSQSFTRDINTRNRKSRIDLPFRCCIFGGKNIRWTLDTNVTEKSWLWVHLPCTTVP